MHEDTNILYNEYRYEFIDNFLGIDNDKVAISNSTSFYISSDIDRPFLDWCDTLDRQKRKYAIVEANLINKKLAAPKKFYAIIIRDPYFGRKEKPKVSYGIFTDSFRIPCFTTEHI